MQTRTLRKFDATIDYEDFRIRLIDLIGSTRDALSGPEVLAIAAYAVGQMVAMQDQRKFTADELMELVSANIHQGNADTVGHLHQTVGRA